MMEGGNSLANEIAELCIKHYNQLPKTGKPNSKQWTIMSAIVEQNKNQLKVVSLGTGSKCIGQNKLCTNGSIVNDSHAEVISRRAFMRYLYEQIDRFYSKSQSIFIENENIKKLQLNEDINFHLFCTQVPCGDASIFPKQFDNDLTGECLINDVQNFNNKRIIDIHRTGAKCLKTEKNQDVHGDGENYHVTGAIRTKPGRGDPTTSKSCSDKLARWVRVGIQGALLTLFIEPIYLTTIILAENVNYSNEAFERALVSRFSNIDETLLNESSYKLHVPKIILSNVPFPHQKQSNLNLCPSSIIWYDSDKCHLEIGVDGYKQGVIKKHLGLSKSQLNICKQQLFHMCMTLIKKHSLYHLLHDIHSTIIHKLTYLDMKSQCKEYNQQWQHVRNHIFKIWTTNNNHDHWLKFNTII